MFLSKMYDGTWSGTMCLTEPTAGSDVGDLLSKAYPTDDPRLQIKGSKIFITGGDGQHVENIIHLYLARIEGAAPGTKGISLFVVPKYWVNEDGSLEPNYVETVGVEHKLGLKGSAIPPWLAANSGTTRGWLLEAMMPRPGRPGDGSDVPDDERGAHEYRNVVAFRNCQRLLERCSLRQGTRPGPPGDPIRRLAALQIINHEDVKRMLLLNKATTEAIRAIVYRACYFNDIARRDPDPGKRNGPQTGSSA